MSGDLNQPPRPRISSAIQRGTDLFINLIEQEKCLVAQEYQQQIQDLQAELAQLKRASTTASSPRTDFSQLSIGQTVKSEVTPPPAASVPLGLDPIAIINVMRTSLEASQRSAQDWETRYNEIKQERDRLRASSQAIVVTMSQKMNALQDELVRLQGPRNPGVEPKSVSLGPDEHKPVASMQPVVDGADFPAATTSRILSSDQELELPHGSQKRSRSTSLDEMPRKLQKGDTGMPQPTEAQQFSGETTI